MTDKTVRSFSIPEDLDDLMRDRDNVNWSGLVTTFLQEYAATGKGTEAAMAVRLEQVESDLAEAKQEVERLERERNRLEAALEERRTSRREIFAAFEDLGHNPETLSPTNPAVEHHAQKLGMEPATFLSKYREWSG